MYYFIVNTCSGKNLVRDNWLLISEALKEIGIEYKAFQTKAPGDATIMAKKISKSEDDDIRIVVMGGDGTINEVINGIEDFDKVSLGVLPLGSANDFLRGISKERESLEILKQILAVEEPRKIDLGKITYEEGERLFAVSSGIGLDAAVCKKVAESSLKENLNKFGMGRYSYILHTATSVFTAKGEDLTFVVDKEETFDFEDVIFLAAMNMPFEGGGVAMSPDALCDDGKLSMCLAHSAKALSRVPAMLNLVRKKHVGATYFAHRDFESLKIHCENPMILHADGEYLGETQDVTMEVIKSKLRLLND